MNRPSYIIIFVFEQIGEVSLMRNDEKKKEKKVYFLD